MANLRQKGHQFQDWCAKFLSERGYCVHSEKKVARRIRVGEKEIWSSSRQDLFGCADIIAISEIEILLVQATLDTAVEKRIKKFRVVPDNPAIKCQVWQKVDTGMVRILDGRNGREVGKILRRKFYKLE